MSAVRLLMVCLAAAGGVVVACGGNSTSANKTVDAPPVAVDACSGSTTCSDPCNLGNDLGVGRYCTEGHSECNANAAPFLFCTKDYEPDDPASYCTGPCSGDNDCGSNAYCSGSGHGGRGCVPMACGGVPSIDGGVPSDI